MTQRPISFRPNQSQELFGVSKSTLYRWIKAGAFKPNKRGNTTIIFTADVEEYLRSLGVIGGLTTQTPRFPIFY